MKEQLKEILADHKLWVESDYQTGKRAEVSGAALRGADLNGAILTYANLNGADLDGANLRGADLRNAYLNGVNLRGADLNGAILHGVGLNRADLTGAHFQLEFKSVGYFRNAIFSEAAIPWVILNPHWTEYADSVMFV